MPKYINTNPVTILLILTLQLLIIIIQTSQIEAKVINYPKIGTWEKQYMEYNIPFHIPSTLEKAGHTRETAAELAGKFLDEAKSHLLPPQDYAVSGVVSKYLGPFVYTLKVPASDTKARAWIKQAVRGVYKEIFAAVLSSYLTPRINVPPPTVLIERDIIPQAALRMPQPLDFTRNTSAQAAAVGPLGDTTTPGHNKTGHYRHRDQRKRSTNLDKRAQGDEEGMDPNIEMIWGIEDMTMLSVPPGLRYRDDAPGFRWKNGGEGVQMFILDGGCDTRHPEFENADINWIFAASPESLDEPGEDSYYYYKTGTRLFGHGTKVASKIVGKTLGVAPKTSIFLTRLQPQIYGIGVLGVTFYAVLLKVYDYIVESRNTRDKKCVVLFPWNSYSTGGESSRDDSFFKIVIKALAAQSCYMVVTSGNKNDPVDDEGNIPITDYPAVLAGDDSLSSNFVVVGGHDTLGYNLFQFNEFVKISAPGAEVVVATPYEGEPPDGYWSEAYEPIEGTSFAAPLVAGLLANFISQGIEDPLGYLLDITRDPPNPKQPRLAFNGIYPDQWPTALRPQDYTIPPRTGPNGEEEPPPKRIKFSHGDA
ncbi:serine protease [Orbilia javanica]|uniref:Serine protease n=1 Tax=Orbilia javanica TaxID=47235 RepID=A0AAN8NXE1_9PEZI